MTHTLLNAGPWTEATVVEAGDIPLVVVNHHGVTVADLPNLFDRGYDAAASAAAIAGLQITGAAVAVYEGDPGATFDLQIAFPVDRTLEEAIEVDGLPVEPGWFPTGKLLVQSVYGAYDELPKHWADLMARAAQMGVVTGTEFGEVYQTMPEPGIDPAALRTDLFVEILQ